ncbi:MAG: 3-hydroxyacyl-CoA dehydrogenase NAD-binding domain-containing protein [Streptosporangiaceae bacterium]
MTSNVIKPAGIREVAVIGLGLMGSGIAELVARSGRRVVAIEINQDFLDQGMARLNASLDRAVSRGKLTDTARTEIVTRIRPTDDIAAGVANADLVIEAIPERMELKRTLYGQLDAACRADAILATNTSSLSVTEIAGGTRYPARVAGLHFFNPAPVMKLVEVISTVLTSPDTTQTLALLARDLGKTPVQVSDRAGFIVNALLLPYLNHAVRLLETAQATREDIDKAATVGLGLPMGPLTLLDLIGLDTSLAVLEVLQAEFGGTRYVPAPLLRKLCDARLFGRKSGRGFYDYRHSTPAAAAEDHHPASVPAEVALIRDSDGLLDELASQITAAGISVVPQPSARTGLVIVAADPKHRVLDAALAAGHPADVVGIRFIDAGDGKPRLAQLVLPDVTAAGTAAEARALAAKVGLHAVISRDRPGFLTEALSYAQFNDAVRMFQDGYASPSDIDTAMMLGCGYPRGPLQMLDDAGPANVVEVLEAMHEATGDPAFTPVPLLAEYATAGTRFRS